MLLPKHPCAQQCLHSVQHLTSDFYVWVAFILSVSKGEESSLQGQKLKEAGLK